MIAILILGSVFIFITAWAIRTDEGYGLGVIAAAILAAPLCAVLSSAQNSEEIWETRPIVAISDGTGFHGYISLFGGSIDSDARYRFYWRDGDRLKLENVEASNVDLHEVPGLKSPRFERYANQFCDDDDHFWTWTCWDRRYEGPQYRVYVPEGSVTRKIDLNLNP
ncbi:membrane protein [Gordonia phage Culver]|nr:hypothetical protein SEA_WILLIAMBOONE_70 [Gordonia phage WilliamBoone]WNM66343.1 membrane protein [Gordonia phage Culver]